jgi:pre-mRNA-processing factor 17
MADSFGEYPPNMAPQDSLVVREHAEPSLAVTPYTGEDLSRPNLGPLNPFKDQAKTLKRKNVLTGSAEETYISEHTFRSKHRAIECRGGPERDYRSGTDVKKEAAKIRARRQKKGDATIADGDGAYVGPWASYKNAEWEEVGQDEELASDEEVEYVYEDDDDVIESGTQVSAPAAALAKRKVVEELGDETTIFHGSEQYDYQGRTYMHVPQDLDVDLGKEVGSIANYIPKKLVHTWKHHGDKAVTALRFFPNSGHLLLSSGADSTVKIFDVYHNKELLRSYCGHTKSITDISFNHDGTQFISGSFDRFMKVWDTETGQMITKFSSGKTPNVLKFNPSVEHSNEFLAGLSDNKIVQYDIRTRELVQEYDHHLNAINTITFVDSNRRFVTTSDDKSIRAWDYNIPVPIKVSSNTCQMLFLLPNLFHVWPKRESTNFKSSSTLLSHTCIRSHVPRYIHHRSIWLARALITKCSCTVLRINLGRIERKVSEGIIMPVRPLTCPSAPMGSSWLVAIPPDLLSFVSTFNFCFSLRLVPRAAVSRAD